MAEKNLEKNEEKIWRLCTYSPAETFEFGYLLGRFVPAGTCLLLSGELGAGKTVCQGFGLWSGRGGAYNQPHLYGG